MREEYITVRLTREELLSLIENYEYNNDYIGGSYELANEIWEWREDNSGKTIKDLVGYWKVVDIRDWKEVFGYEYNEEYPESEVVSPDGWKILVNKMSLDEEKELEERLKENNND